MVLRSKRQSPKTPDKSDATKTNTNIYLLAYGSLRKDEFNHRAIIGSYGKDSMLWLGTYKLPGYKMYDLGYYPTIIPALDELKISVGGEITTKENVVLADIFQITPEVFHAVNDMETGAGYDVALHTITTIKVNGKHPVGFVYYMKELKPQINDGDWSKYNDDILALLGDSLKDTMGED